MTLASSCFCIHLISSCPVNAQYIFWPHRGSTFKHLQLDFKISLLYVYLFAHVEWHRGAWNNASLQKSFRHIPQHSFLIHWDARKMRGTPKKVGMQAGRFLLLSVSQVCRFALVMLYNIMSIGVCSCQNLRLFCNFLLQHFAEQFPCCRLRKLRLWRTIPGSKLCRLWVWSKPICRWWVACAQVLTLFCAATPAMSI